MKVLKQSALTRFLAVAAMSAFLASCGGGSSGTDDPDADAQGAGDFGGGLDPLGDEDNDGITNEIDVDVTGGADENFNGIDDLFESDVDGGGGVVDGGDGGGDPAPAICGGVSGTDEDSSTADWGDNCTLSRSGPHKQSNYTRGVQRVLNCLGYPLTADADFGPATESAVIAFQTDNPPLDADGIVGMQTWGALQDTLASQVFDNSTDSYFVDTQAYDHDGDGLADGLAECFGLTQFYQDVDPATGEGGAWRMAIQPGQIDTIPFSTGIDAVQ